MGYSDTKIVIDSDAYAIAEIDKAKPGLLEAVKSATSAAKEQIDSQIQKLQSIGVVDSDEKQKDVGEIVKSVDTEVKFIEKVRKHITGPILGFKKEIDAEFKGLLEGPEDAIKQAKTSMAEYHDKKEREHQAKLAEIERKEREERERLENDKRMSEETRQKKITEMEIEKEKEKMTAPPAPTSAMKTKKVPQLVIEDVAQVVKCIVEEHPTALESVITINTTGLKNLLNAGYKIKGAKIEMKTVMSR